MICSCCGEDKPLTDYSVDTYTHKPVRQCKECTKIKRHTKSKGQKLALSKFVSSQKRRELRKDIAYGHEDWIATMLWFKGSCAYCGKPEGRADIDKLDKDHLVALSKGGKTTRGNIVPACRKCNRGRGSAEALEWLRKQPFYTPEREARLVEWVKQNGLQ